MAVWLVRAGSHGEHQASSCPINSPRKHVYVTWDGLDVNLANLAEPARVEARLWISFAWILGLLLGGAVR